MTILAKPVPRVKNSSDDRFFTTLPDRDPRGAYLSVGNNSTTRDTQAEPSRHCRCVGAVGGKSSHRDPRCSLECRRNWAWKESLLMTRHLERLPGHVAKYAGTLNVFGAVDLVSFLAMYRRFQKGIRKRFGTCVQIRPVTEIGPRSHRPHIHYAMTADGIEITKADIESVWRDACDGYRIQVDHKPIGDIGTWSRYMFKYDSAYSKHYSPGNPDCVVLFAKGSPRLPQATRDFMPGKVERALWIEWKAGRHRAKESERASSAVPRYLET
jgi:hypothetical protein